jgi:hypothetical protein
VVHNFELATGRGMPYEFDAVVIADFAVWHVEIKGFRGVIEGDAHQWRFENGGVYPSPLPLANKKSKILASRLERHSRRLSEVFVETCILLTDEHVQVRVKDEQARKILRLDQITEHLTDPDRIPVRTGDIRALRPLIEAALAGSAASHKVERIGLYDVLTKINQTPTRTVFLGATATSARAPRPSSRSTTSTSTAPRTRSGARSRPSSTTRTRCGCSARTPT